MLRSSRSHFKLFRKSRTVLRRYLTRKRILRVFLPLLFLSLSFIFLLSVILPSSPFQPNPLSSHSDLTIWHAHPRCQGFFRMQPARDSPKGFPYAVMRDAVIDRRPASLRILGKNDVHGAVRIVLYVTMHLSARLTREGSKVEVEGGDVVGDVEYVTHVTSFLLHHKGTRYQPGQKDRFGREISEWQVGLRLQPKGNGEAVTRAMADGKSMNVGLVVIRYDGMRMDWNINMGLNCVMGWTLPGIEVRGTCQEKGNGVEGGVLFSGSALYGDKKRKRKHFREIANFAARALMGQVKFDVVIMGVVSDYSKEDMYYKCGNMDWACLDKLEERNIMRLRNIAAIVEEELKEIGVPKKLFSKVILVPTCRLGSDANSTEREDNCYKSKRYGQYYASFFSYAIVAPFFKWAVSYDMDEFLASTPSHPIPAGAVHEILDKADESLGVASGDLLFQWLNFRVLSPEDSRALSTNMIAGKRVELANREHANRPEQCYERTRDDTAKSAVRCDVGLGFTIHHPVVASGKHMELKQSNRIYRGLRTWHARLKELKWAHVADCDYAPPKE